jgi:hypothetical protein
MELKDLLPLLRTHGVSKFRDSQYEIEFEIKQIEQSPSQVIDVPEPPNMPPDLRADDLMNADKVLNWSSPDVPADEAPMPLTGDIALEP